MGFYGGSLVSNDRSKSLHAMDLKQDIGILVAYYPGIKWKWQASSIGNKIIFSNILFMSKKDDSHLSNSNTLKI